LLIRRGPSYAAAHSFALPEQFASPEFTQILLDRGIQISMDGKGRCLDSVFVERIWRSVKYERIYLLGYDAIPIGSAPHVLQSLSAALVARRPHARGSLRQYASPCSQPMSAHQSIHLRPSSCGKLFGVCPRSRPRHLTAAYHNAITRPTSPMHGDHLSTRVRSFTPIIIRLSQATTRTSPIYFVVMMTRFASRVPRLKTRQEAPTRS
jgi:hypothetical protein